MSANELHEPQNLIVHLLHRAVQAGDAAFTRQLGARQLTPRQFSLLVAISQEPNLSQTQLVARTGIDRSTMADIIRRLVRENLLQRQRTRNDARSYWVRLTPAGEQTLREAEQAGQRANEDLQALLPPEIRNDFLRGLRMLVSAIGEEAQSKRQKRGKRS
jgi:DNA-binding MarR family transcriptional regulator